MDETRAILWDLAWKVKRAAELRHQGQGNSRSPHDKPLRDLNAEIAAIVEKVVTDPLAYGPPIPDVPAEQPAELPPVEIGAAIPAPSAEQKTEQPKRRKRGGQHES